MQELKSFFARLLHYGTHISEDYDEQERIRAVNCIMIPSFPIAVALTIINFMQGRYPLAFTNLIILACGLTTILVNPYRKYDWVKLIVNITLSVTCTIQAITYHNGSEYFNIQNLLFVLIFFNRKRFIIPSLSFSVGGFIFAKYMLERPPLIEALPQARVIFNMMWSMGMMVFALTYFKRVQFRHKAMLRLQNQQLNKANKTKEKLFSIIAHDLRSPIAQLKGTLDLVNRNFISKEEFQQLSQNFHRQIEQLQGNLDNLLSWSQSQLSGLIAKPQVFSSKEIMEEVLTLFRQVIGQKELQLHVHLHHTMVYMDPDHLRLVFRNLISNAVKFSQRGGTIRVEDSLEQAFQRIMVVDEGVGMTAEQMTHLFHAEEMHTSRGTEQEKGTGLGLNLCKEFLEINGGSIQAGSEPGKGSCFTITIPLAV